MPRYKVKKQAAKSAPKPSLIKKTGERMAPMSEMEKLQAREAELVNELEEIREQLMGFKRARLEELQREIKELGFDLAPAEKKAAVPAGKKGARERKDAPCTVCGYKTDPLHDARSHRQQDVKKPFTDEELASKGMSKV